MPMQAAFRKHWLNAVTAALFALACWRLGLSAELPAVLVFIFGGVLLAVIDWKIRRLPTQLLYRTLGGVGVGLLFASVVERDLLPLATAALGCVLLTSAFVVVWLVTTRTTGMKVLGFGDVRLAAVLGLLLGWYGLSYVVYGMLVGHVLALLVAAVTCVRRRQLVTTFAFGPPLIAGTLAVVLIQA